VKKHAFVLAPVALAAVVLAALWLSGRAANPGPIGLRLDDAWIHLVYGRGLLANGYLAYDDGVPSTGCTSPLWAICLAVLHVPFGRSVDAIVLAVILTGSALHLAGVAVGASLAGRVTGSRRAGGAAGALIALATPWAAASFSGMEVALTGLLLLLAVRALAADAWRTAGAWLALAWLARPEVAAVAIGAAALAAARGGSDAIRRVGTPTVVAAAAVAAHHLWASGSPLPATFLAKSSTSLPALPGRLATALGEMLPGVPPFAGGLGWIAALGLAGRDGGTALRRALPFLVGVTFLLANLLVLDPVDPAAFYHLRYVLPAVPLLLVGLAIGAHGLGGRLPARAAAVPTAVLLALSVAGAAATIGPVSRHFHNDVRNINEVQRRIGEWLRENVPPGRWIASSDAGAVRYFSRLPTIDVIGLNTPEMLRGDESFVRERPVDAIVFLPAWFRADSEDLTGVFRARTENYTVTSNPAMSLQIVARAKPGGPDDGPTVRVRFVGFRSFELDFVRPTRPGADAAP